MRVSKLDLDARAAGATSSLEYANNERKKGGRHVERVDRSSSRDPYGLDGRVGHKYDNLRVGSSTTRSSTWANCHLCPAGPQCGPWRSHGVLGTGYGGPDQWRTELDVPGSASLGL